MSLHQLNELGREGWEHYAVADNCHFFKRKCSIDAAPEPEQVKESIAKTKRAK